jgi:hypothetical protein
MHVESQQPEKVARRLGLGKRLPPVVSLLCVSGLDRKSRTLHSKKLWTRIKSQQWRVKSVRKQAYLLIRYSKDFLVVVVRNRWTLYVDYWARGQRLNVKL